jgi:hypothetical protein
MDVWVICHFLEAWDDIEVILSRLKKMGISISVVCAEGNLFDGKITSTSKSVRDYLEGGGILWNISESEFIDLVDSNEHFLRNNIIMPLTHYPGSLSEEMRKVLSRAEHIHYIPYGYPVREITDQQSAELDPGLRICKLYAEDDHEAEVWSATQRVRKVIISERVFLGKRKRTSEGASRVLINFHHAHFQEGKNYGARGALVNLLDDLRLIFNENPNLSFILMFHPIFWLKLMAADRTEQSSMHQEWEKFSENLYLFPNVSISTEFNWKSEWEKSTLILAESPSLIFKGSKLFPRKNLLIAHFNPKIASYPTQVLGKRIPIVTNMSEFRFHLNSIPYSEDRVFRVSSFLRHLPNPMKFLSFHRSLRILRKELSNCDHSD